MAGTNLTMSRDHIAGFMLGVSAGVAIGYFLRPPADKTTSRAARDVMPGEPERIPKRVERFSRVRQNPVSAGLGSDG